LRRTPGKGTATEFGASIFFTDYSITPAELAVALEKRGFDPVWAAKHSHIPVPRKTPAPGRSASCRPTRAGSTLNSHDD
jgi:alkanesulfonate monooxygenase SsuD/methylene tetrahydromethanopterin reductase-like flavin-dependent oxidoreductase (luciferase family)